MFVFLSYSSFSFNSNTLNTIKIIGKWIDIDNENKIIEIKKFGNNLILVSDKKTFVITTKDNIYFALINGVEKPILYDKTTDTILFNDIKFKRFSKSVKEKILGVWKCDESMENSYCGARDKIMILKDEHNNYFIKFFLKNGKTEGPYKLKYKSGYFIYTHKTLAQLGGSKAGMIDTEDSFELIYKNGKPYIKFEFWEEGDNWVEYYKKLY